MAGMVEGIEGRGEVDCRKDWSGVEGRGGGDGTQGGGNRGERMVWVERVAERGGGDRGDGRKGRRECQEGVKEIEDRVE